MLWLQNWPNYCHFGFTSSSCRYHLDLLPCKIWKLQLQNWWSYGHFRFSSSLSSSSSSCRYHLDLSPCKILRLQIKKIGLFLAILNFNQHDYHQHHHDHDHIHHYHLRHHHLIGIIQIYHHEKSGYKYSRCVRINLFSK